MVQTDHKMRPDREDIEAIEHQFRPLPASATDAEQIYRQRLYRIHKIMRLYEQGRLSPELTREIDNL
jgi:hypothetical protein